MPWITPGEGRQLVRSTIGDGVARQKRGARYSETVALALHDGGEQRAVRRPSMPNSMARGFTDPLMRIDEPRRPFERWGCEG